MSRRDMIIIGAIINAGILALLFVFAVNSDDDKVRDQTEIMQTLGDVKMNQELPTTSVAAHHSEGIESPKLSENEQKPQTTLATVEDAPILDLDQDEDIPLVQKAPAPIEETVAKTETIVNDDAKVVEIKVKSGDSLDKIARANGTTIKAIKAANDLKTDKLRIGQVLKIPLSKEIKKKTTAVAKQEKKQKVSSSDQEFYTIKSGDNPWKVAKQFHLKVDELLALNNMSEEKARNLKIGDKIRIR